MSKKLYKDILPQLVGKLTMVPYGHHRIIIDKCKTLDKYLFYIRTTIILNYPAIHQYPQFLYPHIGFQDALFLQLTFLDMHP